MRTRCPMRAASAWANRTMVSNRVAPSLKVEPWFNVSMLMTASPAKSMSSETVNNNSTRE